jgi:Leucine Rich repeat
VQQAEGDNHPTESGLCPNPNPFTTMTTTKSDDHYYEEFKKKGGRYVTLGYKRLSYEDAKQIAKVLRDPETKVQNLCLDMSSIGDEGTTAIAKALTVKNCPSLQELWKLLSSSKFGVVGAKDIAQACEKASTVRSTLQVLSLFYNNIGVVGATSLAETLKNNMALQELDLSWNGYRR